MADRRGEEDTRPTGSELDYAEIRATAEAWVRDYDDITVEREAGRVILALLVSLREAEEQLATEARLRIKDCEDRNAQKGRADTAERRLREAERALRAARAYVGDRPIELVRERDQHPERLIGSFANPKWLELVEALAALVGGDEPAPREPIFRITLILDGDDYVPTMTDNAHAALEATLRNMEHDGLIRGYTLELERE